MDSLKILIAEDDSEINRLISRYLSKEGYKIDSAYDGREALAFLSSNDYQLVILDIMLPELDGFEVLDRIRERNRIPVIILSAKAGETDKIFGLNLGADDYLTKPFSIYELIARVKAQLRRYMEYDSSQNIETNILKHNGIEMDLSGYSVKVHDKAVLLTAKEFEILKLFMTCPKKVFTKEQIFSAVWNDDYLCDDNTVIVHIRRLREKIEDDASKPQYILTVWGIGYKLKEG